VVVGHRLTELVNVAAKDSVRIGVTRAFNLPAAVDELVSVLTCRYGVHHNGNIAACGVLHTNGNVKTAGCKSVVLVFNTARAYCNVGKKVGKVTVVFGVKHFVCRGKTCFRKRSHMELTDSNNTLESIGRLGRIDLKDIMGNFVYWLANGAFTPYGEVFDVGGTTRKAIAKYNYQGRNPETCGCGEIMDNGNGSLMRILPLAFFPHSINDVCRVSALTHAHDISKIACVFYLCACHLMICGAEKNNIIEIASFFDLPKEFERIKRLDQLTRDEIKSTGYVIDTLEAALWCLIHTDSYKECVLTAVNLGDDTDTVAAVAGGLAGIFYGVGGANGIPEEWIDQIARKKWIKGLCDRFENTLSMVHFRATPREAV
jgi:ADP-ribosylglycohydrolase